MFVKSKRVRRRCAKAFQRLSVLQENLRRCSDIIIRSEKTTANDLED